MGDLVAMMGEKSDVPAAPPAREETGLELLRRAGHNGGMKRATNVWRRRAEAEGISLQAYLERREKKLAEARQKAKENQLKWAQEREEAARLGVTVAWYRSEKFKATQRGQLIADGQLEDLVIEAKLHKAKMEYGRAAARKIGIKYSTFRALSEEDKLRRLEAADKSKALSTAPRRKARKDPS